MSRWISSIFARSELALIRLKRKCANACGLRSRNSDSSGKREMELLRRVLRNTPGWIEGHLSLAHSELEALHRADGKKDPRSIACVRVSARAALALMMNRNEIDSALKLEALYLLAMSDCFDGKLEEGLAGLTQVVDSGDGSKLQVKILHRAFEYAAAAAMPLGKRKEALALIERVPLNHRNPELVAAHKMLSDSSLNKPNIQ